MDGNIGEFVQWGFYALVAAIGRLFWTKQDKLESKLDNVYSKHETQEQIDLKLQPLREAVLLNTAAVEKLTDTMVQLRVDFAGIKSDVHYAQKEQGTGAETEG